MDQFTKDEMKEIRKEMRDLTHLLREMDSDLHMVKESYIEKLQKIKKEGKLLSRKDAEKELGILFS